MKRAMAALLFFLPNWLEIVIFFAVSAGFLLVPVVELGIVKLKLYLLGL